jgi:hypothetical protein
MIYYNSIILYHIFMGFYGLLGVREGEIFSAYE